jgi:arsenate reductase
MKEIYGIDMEKSQYSKLISDIPPVDIVVTMGCNVTCPYLPCKQKFRLGVEDPTGKNDDTFRNIISIIEKKVIELRNMLNN